MLTVVVLAVFLLMPRVTFSQPRPLCVTQFAIANQACAFVAEEQDHGGHPQNKVQILRHENHVRGHREDEEGEHGRHRRHGHRSDGGGEHEHEHKRHGGGEHEHEHKRHGGGEHEHEHKRHGGGEHHREHHPRANTDCCRWLKEVDDDCVCAALLRLPTFLSKPAHGYTVKVGDTCEVHYKCEIL